MKWLTEPPHILQGYSNVFGLIIVLFYQKRQMSWIIFQIREEEGDMVEIKQLNENVIMV